MTTTSDFYTKQAIQCEQDAEATALENVRERCLRSARTWRSLAERLTRAETMRTREAEEKAALRAEAEPGGGLMSEQDEIAALLMSGLDWAEAHLHASLEEPLGAQCVTTFASVLEYDLANGALSYAELRDLHSAGPSPADVGLGLIEGVIATIRAKMAGEPANPNVDRIVEGLERAAGVAIMAGAGARG